MTYDPFAHVPELRDRIIAADASAMRFTKDVLAQRDARAREMGYGAGWRQPDHHIAAAWEAFLSARSTLGDLWIFGYGSLMWDPGFRFAEVRRDRVDGYRRRFTMKVEVITGSAESPALALALQRHSGWCDGLAFRIPIEFVRTETEVLWRRELVLFDYLPERAAADTPQGPIEVILFAEDRNDPDYVGERPLAETAKIIADAGGLQGGNRGYVERLAQQLDALGMRDDYVVHLLDELRKAGAEAHPASPTA